MATARDIAKQFVRGNENITTLLPTLIGSSPGNAFKDSPAVLAIVRGYQVALNRLGAKVPVTGVIDPRTAWAARQVSGDAWTTHKWLSLYDDASKAIFLGKQLKAAPGGNTGVGYLGMGDVVSDAVKATPLPVLGSVVRLALITTPAQAKDYAAAAFNVCIQHVKTSTGSARTAWASAAEAYAAVYTMLIPGVMSVASAKSYLAGADRRADAARRTGGSSAPPVPAGTSPALEAYGQGGGFSMAGLPSWLLPVALAGGAAFLLFGKKKGRRGIL